MTARDYLAERQSLFRRYDYLVQILRDRRDMTLSGRAVEGDKTPDQLLAEVQPREAPPWATAAYEEGYARQAHELFLSRVSDQGRALLDSLDLAIGELDTANFSASTLPVPTEPRAFVLVFTGGLSALVYEVARAVTASTNIAAGPTREGVALS